MRNTALPRPRPSRAAPGDASRRGSARPRPAAAGGARLRRAPAGPAAIPPRFRHRKDVLPNGLRVVTVELPHLHTAALVMYVRVGSRFERPEDNGLSHFVEHMLFRGTARYPSSYALNFAIEELGGTLYAETGRDYSLYQISLDPELLAQGIELFGEIFRAPAFTQIALERQMVLEEINEDLDEDGHDVNLDDLGRAAAFPDHPLGQKITGPAANVERFTVRDVRRHFARHYGAPNLILTIAGPVRREPVVELARAALGALPSCEVSATTTPAEPSDGPRVAYVRLPGAQTSAQLLFRALPERHPDFVALQALGRVLDDGMSTRLHYTLCDQLGLAYSVNAFLEPYHDTALFALDGAAAHAKLVELVRRMLDLVGRLRDEPVSDAELAKAKRRYRYDLASAFDDAEAMAGWYGGTELFYPPPSFEEKIGRMDAVTPADVQRAAALVVRPERLVVAAAGALTTRQRRELDRTIRAWA